MKKLYYVYETVERANEEVNFLLSMGVSAYRQGFNVYIDDGGEDLGL